MFGLTLQNLSWPLCLNELSLNVHNIEHVRLYFLKEDCNY